MRERVPSYFQKTSSSKSPAHRSVAHFTSEERRKIFKGMVVGELEDGFLRYSKRQALLKYAATLNIPEFEACLLIAEAQYYSGDIEPISFNTATTIDNIEPSAAWSIPMRLGLALVVAIFVDLLLIYCVF